jgi:hypothetical protein
VVVLDLERDVVPRTDVVPKAAHVVSDLDAFLQVLGGVFLCEFVRTKTQISAYPSCVSVSARLFPYLPPPAALRNACAAQLLDPARLRDGETFFKQKEV